MRPNTARVRWSLLSVAVLIATACTNERAVPSAAPHPTGATASSTSAAATPGIAIATLHGSILFTRAGGRFGDETVFTANADGTGQRRITGFGTQCCPRWSPDGSHISISAGTPDGRITTGIIDPDGSHERKIPLPPGTLNLGCAVWSPDGIHVACEGWDDAHDGRQGIYRTRLDGGNLVRVTHCSRAQDDRPMDFSPDGKQIFFFRAAARFPRVSGEPLGSLFVVNVDGTDVRRVTPRDVAVEVAGNAGGRARSRRSMDRVHERRGHLDDPDRWIGSDEGLRGSSGRARDHADVVTGRSIDPLRFGPARFPRGDGRRASGWLVHHPDRRYRVDATGDEQRLETRTRLDGSKQLSRELNRTRRGT